MIVAVAVRPLRAGDVDVLVGVLRRAYQSRQNFELRLRSYLRMRGVATFIAETGAAPVGMVVGNDYGPTAYVSQMAVEPALQGRGIGARLMDALIAWTDARGFAAVELDATPAGAKLYPRYGFVEVARTDVYVNGAAAVRASGRFRAYRATDAPALFAADAAAFGADRREVLELLFAGQPESVVVAGRGRTIGYAVAQVRTELLGPVIASSPGLAGELIDAARAKLPFEHRISVPSSNAAVAGIVTARGYRFARSLAHMVRGRAPEAQRDRVFARINLGQG